jgi:hypothetical protein
MKTALASGAVCVGPQELRGSGALEIERAGRARAPKTSLADATPSARSRTRIEGSMSTAGPSEGTRFPVFPGSAESKPRADAAVDPGDAFGSDVR